MFSFPKDVLVTNGDQDMEKPLDDFKSIKTITFVSEDCPVSMVDAVRKARQFVDQRHKSIMIFVPLQKLSEKHLTMRKMVSGGNMLF